MLASAEDDGMEPPIRTERGQELHERVPPHMWCITRQDLVHFESTVRQAWLRGEIPDNQFQPNKFHHDPDIGPNIHQVNEHFIKPITRHSGGMSYALMLHPSGLPCDLFVTHCWAEGIFEFCRKCLSAWPKGRKHLWCCFTANPQNANIAELLMGSVMQSPFAKALRHAKHMLVIPNRHCSIYLRLWCVLEAKLAIEHGLEITLPSAVPRTKLAIAMGQVLACWVPAMAYSIRITMLYYTQQYVHWAVATVVPLLCSLFVRFRPKSTLLVRACAQAVFLGLWGGIPYYVLFQSTQDPYRRLVVAGLVLGLFTVGGQWTFEQLKQAVLQNESDQLTFTSVVKATCSSSFDEVRLRAAISGQEDEIDGMISTLRAVGTYNEAVRDDCAKGFDPAQGRRLDISNAALMCFFSGFCLTLVEVRASSPLGYWYKQAPGAVTIAAVFLPGSLLILSASFRPGVRSTVFALRCIWFCSWGLAAALLAVDVIHRGTHQLSRRMCYVLYAWCTHSELFVVVALLTLGQNGTRGVVRMLSGHRHWLVAVTSLCFGVLWGLYSSLSRGHTYSCAIQWTTEIAVLMALWIAIWVAVARRLTFVSKQKLLK